MDNLKLLEDNSLPSGEISRTIIATDGLSTVYIKTIEEELTYVKLFNLYEGELLLISDYVFPTSETTFASPYLNWKNFTFVASSDSWDDPYLLRAVPAGKKLFASLFFQTEADKAAYLAALLSENHVQWKSPTRGYSRDLGVEVFRRGSLTDYFDLQLLISSYGDLGVELNADEVAYLAFLAQLPLGEASEQYDWASPDERVEWIVTGLLLGYPIETTASLLWLNE